MLNQFIGSIIPGFLYVCELASAAHFHVSANVSLHLSNICVYVLFLLLFFSLSLSLDHTLSYSFFLIFSHSVSLILSSMNQRNMKKNDRRSDETMNGLCEFCCAEGK